MPDNRFCKFIGIDKTKKEKILKEVYSICKVSSLQDINEYDAVEKIVIDFWKNEYSKFTELSLMDLYYEIVNLDNYQKDFDIIKFMYVGSELSQIEKKEFAVKTKIPFGLKKKNNKYFATAWCRSYKECMMADNKKHFFDVDGTWVHEMIENGTYKPNRNRITKYSYCRMRKLKKDVCLRIGSDKKELQNLCNLERKRDQSEEDKKKVLSCMTENGIENLLVLDMTFGLSLTTIIYHHLKEVDEMMIYKCIPLIKELVKLRCFNFRNQLADGILGYIAQNDFEASCIEKITNLAKETFPIIDRMYRLLLYIKWDGLCGDIAKLGEKQVWEECIEENIFDIQELQYMIYEKELLNDERKQRDMVELPNGKHEVMEWLKLAQKYRMNIAKIDFEKIKGAVEKENEAKWNNDKEIRSDTKIVSKIEKYTKIHEIVMVFTVENLLN